MGWVGVRVLVMVVTCIERGVHEQFLVFPVHLIQSNAQGV